MTSISFKEPIKLISEIELPDNVKVAVAVVPRYFNTAVPFGVGLTYTNVAVPSLNGTVEVPVGGVPLVVPA